MNLDDTILGYILAEIHADFDFENRVYVAYDLQHRLLVVQEFYLLETPERVSRTIAIVSADEAFRLSRRLGIGMKDVTVMIADTFRYQEYFDSSMVIARFQDVLNLLLDNGVHYRIVMQYT
jgi:hypothetical protein